MMPDMTILARLAQACEDAVREYGDDIPRIDEAVARWRAALDPGDRRRLDATASATRHEPDGLETMQ